MSISSIQTGVTTVAGLANIAVISPKNTVGYQPQKPGYTQATANGPALLFHYEGENSIVLQSDITDHYTEANVPIQDQIAIKPEEITVHGYIGDLNNVPPNAAFAAAQVAAQKLVLLSAYTPQLTVTALEAYNEAILAYQTAQTAAQAVVSVYQSIGGGQGLAVVNGNGITNITSPGAFSGFTSNQTPQQIMFQQFYGFWFSKTLFTVQTPWAVFQNMAIKTLRAIQDETTQNVTDFEVTFKMIRYAQSTVTTVGQGRWNNQSAPPINSQSTVSPSSTPFPGIAYA